jgi:hypothetical protein
LAGKNTMHYLAANLAVHTGISPREFIEMDPILLAQFIRVLNDKGRAETAHAKRHRRP